MPTEKYLVCRNKACHDAGYRHECDAPDGPTPTCVDGSQAEYREHEVPENSIGPNFVSESPIDGAYTPEWMGSGFRSDTESETAEEETT